MGFVRSWACGTHAHGRTKPLDLGVLVSKVLIVPTVPIGAVWTEKIEIYGILKGLGLMWEVWWDEQKLSFSHVLRSNALVLPKRKAKTSR